MSIVIVTLKAKSVGNIRSKSTRDQRFSGEKVISWLYASKLPLGVSSLWLMLKRDLENETSGVGKSCLLLRFSDGSFTTSFITTIGIDFKIRTVELDGKRIKLQIWDTAGQERFRTITTAYYRGAMGILLVYDVTDESSFNNIRNWIRNIEQHASDNVNKILVGNKADMDESKRAVPTSKGQALADEYGIKFFETSAKTNLNVEEVFFSIARDIKQRLSDTDTKAEPTTIKINQPDAAGGAGQLAQKSACCGS
ncbi:hypothetical protein DH2020_028277 [Rehmannia glutinosa]|uniref:Uncharacterized protein n=1 Tax=Rehmannia glutinosa TaxID=99300 RepID=A0ABR0VST3_REHGL